MGIGAVQAHLGLEKIHGNSHSACELRPILMKDEKVVNVQDTANAKLLEEAHEGAKQFGADAGGLGHTEAYCSPLEPAAVRWVAETAILALGRVQAKVK